MKTTTNSFVITSLTVQSLTLSINFRPMRRLSEVCGLPMVLFQLASITQVSRSAISSPINMFSIQSDRQVTSHTTRTFVILC